MVINNTSTPRIVGGDSGFFLVWWSDWGTLTYRSLSNSGNILQERTLSDDRVRLVFRQEDKFVVVANSRSYGERALCVAHVIGSNGDYIRSDTLCNLVFSDTDHERGECVLVACANGTLSVLTVSVVYGRDPHFRLRLARHTSAGLSHFPMQVLRPCDPELTGVPMSLACAPGHGEVLAFKQYAESPYELWYVLFDTSGTILPNITQIPVEAEFSFNAIETVVRTDLVLSLLCSSSEEVYLCTLNPWLTPVLNDPSSSPRSFQLTAYPNPFNPSTKITWDVEPVAAVRLRILNVLGQSVLNQWVNQTKGPPFVYEWDAIGMPSGTYTVYPSNGERQAVTRVTLLR